MMKVARPAITAKPSAPYKRNFNAFLANIAIRLIALLVGILLAHHLNLWGAV